MDEAEAPSLLRYADTLAYLGEDERLPPEELFGTLSAFILACARAKATAARAKTARPLSPSRMKGGRR